MRETEGFVIAVFAALVTSAVFATGAQARDAFSSGAGPGAGAPGLAAAADLSPSPQAAGSEGNASQAAGRSAVSVEEIIVTAQRRSENLQRVPISVTAVTSKALDAAGVTNLVNLPAVAPGVVLARTFAGVTPFIRGVGIIQSGFTSESPVAMYIDGVYIPNSGSANFALNDVARIEVLKGPQGTLFGRNAIGGLINVITRDPDATPGVEASLAYENYRTVDANFYGTTGLTENLAVNFSGQYRDQADGWGKNLFNGEDLFKGKSLNLSAKAVWRPTDNTKITLRGMYDHASGNFGAAWGVFPGSVGVDGTRYVSEYKMAIRLQPYNKHTQENTGLRIEQSLGSLKLISISGFNHIRSNFLGNSTPILGNLTPGRGVNNLLAQGYSDTFSEELQLQSAGTSALQWIVGGFYMHDHYNVGYSALPTCIGAACNPSPVPTRTQSDQVLNSYAVFGEATLTIAPGTRITGGIRYTSDHKDASGSYKTPIPGYPTSLASLAPPLFFGDVGAVSPKASYSKVTFRAVLAHDFTDTITAYASMNRGFKAGGFNILVFNNPVVKPEILDAYEVGVKSELFDRRLRLNVAGFYYDYSNLQLRSLAPPAPPGLSFLLNAGSAHIKGIDVDALLAVTSNFTLSGQVEVLDAKFASFPGGICTYSLTIGGAVLGGASSRACDLAGSRLQNAPKFTANIGGDYRIPTSFGQIELNASDSYNSGFYWNSDNRLRQPSYHQVNASVTWTPPSGRYSVQVYGHNLNNPRYFLSVSEASSGSDAYTPGDPRTYGVKVGVKF